MIGQLSAYIGLLAFVVVLSAGVGALVALHVGCPAARAAMHAPVDEDADPTP